MQARLKLVGDHVAQALVVHGADVDVGRKLLARHAAHHRLACTPRSLSIILMGGVRNGSGMALQMPGSTPLPLRLADQQR